MCIGVCVLVTYLHGGGSSPQTSYNGHTEMRKRFAVTFTLTNTGIDRFRAF